MIDLKVLAETRLRSARPDNEAGQFLDRETAQAILDLTSEVFRLKSETCACCVENDCDCMEGVTWGEGS